MAQQGTFCVARAVFDHPIVGPRGVFTRFEAWAWLLSEASYRARTVGRGDKVVTLQRGQLAHSLRFIAKGWGWSEPAVRRFLTRLKTAAQIDARSDAGITVITICNYDRYNFGNGETDAPIDARSDAIATQRRRKREEGKKERKESKTGANPKGWPDDAFDQWWAVVPKRVDRKEAVRAFDKLRATGEIEFAALIIATQRWTISVKDREPRYIKAPSVWINKGGYLDEVAPRPSASSPAQPPDNKLLISHARNVPPETWSARVRDFADNPAFRWNEAVWGPKPGQPGCMAPPASLTAYGFAKGTMPPDSNGVAA